MPITCHSRQPAPGAGRLILAALQIAFALPACSVSQPQPPQSDAAANAEATPDGRADAVAAPLDASLMTSPPGPFEAGDEASSDDASDSPDAADAADGAVDLPIVIRDARDARVPAHRATAGPCPAQRGAGITGGSPGPDAGRCRNDADCADRVNGRCVYEPSASDGISLRYVCSYDECSGDAECASGLACVCRSSDQDRAANYCAPAGNCRMDADCGPPGYCSFSRDRVCPSGTNLGYFCHTPDDECTGEGECEGGGCTYNIAVHHWACSRASFCVDASQ